MEDQFDRRKYVEACMIRYGKWVRSERGVQGYPRKATLHNVIEYGPSGAAAIRGAEAPKEIDCPLEESIEQAISHMANDKFYERVAKCLKARYVGLIRGKYYSMLQDTEAAKFLSMERRRYYEDIDRGLRFIDGWLSARRL